jgi:hypothetical protein
VAWQLVDAGLLSRTPHRPGRPIELELTAAGGHAVTRAGPGVSARDAQLQSRIRPDLRAPIDRTLRYLLSNLGQEQDPSS